MDVRLGKTMRLSSTQLSMIPNQETTKCVYSHSGYHSRNCHLEQKPEEQKQNKVTSNVLFVLSEFLQIFISFHFKKPYSLHKIGFEVFSCVLALSQYSGLDVVGWVDFGGDIYLGFC